MEQELLKRIEALEKEIQEMKKKMIETVGPFDGTNIAIRTDGIRRKIATSAP